MLSLLGYFLMKMLSPSFQIKNIGKAPRNLGA
jgi:hypothetical protein